MTAIGGPQTGRNPLLPELLERIGDRVPADRSEVVADFARHYARRLPGDAVASLDVGQLFGQVMGAFELADRRGDSTAAVRVFNPTTSTDGYSTSGTVVETNTPDSPFLVDSVTGELQARGLAIRLLLHPVLGVGRDAFGRITRVAGVREIETRESVMHFEVDRRLEPAEQADLEAAVRRVLADVRTVVADFDPMKRRAERMIEAAHQSKARYGEDEIRETIAFLDWLLHDTFVFLGYREYQLVDADGGRALAVVPDSGLGILSDTSRSSYAEPVQLASIEAKLRERIEGGDLLTVSKTNSQATVHRRARMDYIGVKRVGSDGGIAGELRLIGLFTSKAYMETAGRIPLLRRKVQQILAAEDFYEGSHDYKAAIGLIESFPLDELFAASTEDLRAQISSLLELQEQQKVRLFERRDLYDRSVSLLVALPRDRFNAPLRQKLQQLFMERFNGSSVDYHLALGESDPALVHFTIHVAEGQIPEVGFSDLEQEVVALTRTWDDRLREHLVSIHGEERGRRLAETWAPRLPEYYKSSTDIVLAAVDAEQFDRVETGEPFVVALQNERAKTEILTRVGLYKTGDKVALSDFVPILEDLGLTVVEEVPTRLVDVPGGMFLHDFGVLDGEGGPLDLNECAVRVAECVSAVWRREAESDSLNRLVIDAGLTWRQVEGLRAARKYRRRVSAGFNEEYVNDAFAANPGIAARIVRLFELRLDPKREPDPAAEDALRGEILADLDAVASLDQDRILRSTLGLVEATVRTNAFRPGRSSLAFKLRSAAVPDMPKPHPLFEIFVYTPEMEGLHLRAGKVARGGIRWSDRMEDYRTEILGLMKAQTTKNAVIVPTGSKGGFVVTRPPKDPSDLGEEAQRQYATLVRGLLDLTDNLVDGQIVHPDHVRVLDEGDAYLVVAADKGTARFSDAANAIAAEYGYWLGDAFASGGSSGYDHRALGITARGAWESVKRHFRELGHDVATEPFTVVGIGDMSGDVFGNGMLLSDTLRLVAAFDHRHLFVDPDPDAAAGFAERKRLFERAGSTWNDYDRSTISAGGGVWPRTAKSVQLAPEAQRALGVEAASMAPNDLIRAILRAPADLLWNGGVGTFVKAAEETNAEVGDRANDPVRVDGGELRVRVVGEAGNLGFSQRGRIEYARAGGRINTDFIDNSGGVDTSDREVNAKILLGLAVARGDLTVEQRDELLAEVAEDVVDHVLYDNYLQAQILSQEVARAVDRVEGHEELMRSLESEGLLDRGVEHLPTSEEIAEHVRNGSGLTRPELSVLLAYAKLSLKRSLLASPLPDDPYLERDLHRYFAARIVDGYGGLLSEHPLRRELVATIVANDVVNSEGITYVSRTVAETGAGPADVARAYRIAREVTGAVARWDAIEALDGVVDPVLQDELLTGVDRLVERVSRWYLLNAPGVALGEAIEAGGPAFSELSDALVPAGPDAWRARCESEAQLLVGRGVPEDVARRHAYQDELVRVPDMLGVAVATSRPLPEVARAFLLLGGALHLDWLEEQVEALPATSRWDVWALNAIADDLRIAGREAAERALAASPEASPEDAVATFLSTRATGLERATRLVEQLAAEGVPDLAVLTVAVRQVRGAIA